jgi:hypothetical protein
MQNEPYIPILLLDDRKRLVCLLRADPFFDVNAVIALETDGCEGIISRIPNPT